MGGGGDMIATKDEHDRAQALCYCPEVSSGDRSELGRICASYCCDKHEEPEIFRTLNRVEKEVEGHLSFA